MNSYEILLDEANNKGLIVKEKPLKNTDGRIKGRKIAIRESLNTTVEKRCVLAEELGHYYTTYGEILNYSLSENMKQERKARIYSYNKLVGLDEIVRAYKSGCQNQYEISETLGITEEFLEECIGYYREKYGTCTEIGNYIIIFIPNLIIIEKQELPTHMDREKT